MVELGFQQADLLPLAPEIAILGSALLILLIDSFSRGKHGKAAVAIAAASVAAAFAASLALYGTTAEAFGGTFVVDGFSLFFNVAILLVTALVVVSSLDYLEEFYPEGADELTEYVVLLLFATAGMMLMASSRSLVTAFIALELAALPSYALVAFAKRNRASIEGGMKYFVLGALSSAFLLYGISLVYGATGAFDFVAIADAIAAGDVEPGVLSLGSLLVLFGLAFKVAAVPFHVWAPDAYTGAPTTIAAFVSSASKIAGFVLLFRLFTTAFPAEVDWVYAAIVLSVVTMTYGNFAAAVQDSVKRMLAYSSIAHAGYALIAVAVFSAEATGDSAFALGAGMSHLLVYGLMNTGAFLVVALVDDYYGAGYTFEDYAGLGRKMPAVGLAMAVFMLSLAGLPTGGGFVSKLVLFAGAVNSGFWWLALLGGVNSALSLYYYTRVLKWMWVEEAPEDQVEVDRKPLALYASILFAAVATVALLFAFAPVIETATAAAEALLE